MVRHDKGGQAFRNGEELYFTGTPCHRNHIASRMVANAKCIECLREIEAEFGKERLAIVMARGERTVQKRLKGSNQCGGQSGNGYGSGGINPNFCDG